MQQAGEPTVEEILESIKKVIARDNRAEAALERRQRENSGMSDKHDGADEDILDLAEEAEMIEGSETDEGADDESLVNETAQASMRESLAALSMLSQPGASPQIVRSGETSLEGMVRELLRPALAEWLDKNLPPLVERMVAAEIKRIAGKKG
jgi:cell pole-organizing protein PopZ